MWGGVASCNLVRGCRHFVTCCLHRQGRSEPVWGMYNLYRKEAVGNWILELSTIQKSNKQYEETKKRALRRISELAVPQVDKGNVV